MQLPDVLTVTATLDDGTPVPGLLLQLEIRAGKKNPYYILFPYTGADGVARVPRADFVGQWKDHWESGLMDYDGSIEDAVPRVIVSLFDSGPLLANKSLTMKWPLLKHESTKWGSRQEAFTHLASSDNRRYVLAPTVIDLEADPTFSVRLRSAT